MNLKDLFTAIKQTLRDIRRRRLALAEKRHRRNLAEWYNEMFTYRGSMVQSGQWMCPECNKIHVQNGYCAFGGRLFPACCHFAEGVRCFDDCATVKARSNLYSWSRA